MGTLLLVKIDAKLCLFKPYYSGALPLSNRSSTSGVDPS